MIHPRCNTDMMQIIIIIVLLEKKKGKTPYYSPK